MNKLTLITLLLATAAIAGCSKSDQVKSPTNSPNVPTTPDPVKLSPQYYNVLLDNEKVRVLEYRLRPGEKEPMHSHPCGVVYFFSDAEYRTIYPDGRTTEGAVTAGQTTWRNVTTHAAVNIGTTDVHGLAVEIKGGCE